MLLLQEVPPGPHEVVPRFGQAHRVAVHLEDAHVRHEAERVPDRSATKGVREREVLPVLWTEHPGFVERRHLVETHRPPLVDVGPEDRLGDDRSAVAVLPNPFEDPDGSSDAEVPPPLVIELGGDAADQSATLDRQQTSRDAAPEQPLKGFGVGGASGRAATDPRGQ